MMGRRAVTRVVQSTKAAPQQTKKSGNKADNGHAVQKVNHLLTLLRHRHPDGLPDDGKSREALQALVGLAIHLTKMRPAKLAEIYKLASWASEDERDDLERQALVEKWWPSVDELGAKFDVTKEERHGLETWQLGAIGEGPEERAANAAEKHRERQREWRRRERADRGGKPSARSRQDRLLEEMPHAPIAIADLVKRVCHLDEYKLIKDKIGAVHKDADALKTRGLLVDEQRQQDGGRRLMRWVRKARESDRRAEVSATNISTPRRQLRQGTHLTTPGPGGPSDTPDSAAWYLARVRQQLKLFNKNDLLALAKWFRSPEEEAVRARCALTPEQLVEARRMWEFRMGEL